MSDLTPKESTEVLKEAHNELKEMFTKHSRAECREKCHKYFTEYETTPEFQEMILSQKAMMVFMKFIFDEEDKIEKGLQFIRNSYKTEKPNQPLSKEDDLLVKETLGLVCRYITESPSRIAVLRVDPIKPHYSQITHLLRKTRYHPLRPTNFDNLPEGDQSTKYLDDLSKDILESITYVDQDQDHQDHFKGFLLIERRYFKEDPYQLGYKTMSEWLEKTPDYSCWSIHPIDTDPEEYRNVGYTFETPVTDGQTYQTLVYQSWLVNFSEQNGLTASSKKPAAKEVNQLY